MDEREAIARLKRGDIGGLEMLVRLYQTPAIRASYLIAFDQALAEDVVQAAFIRAYERIEMFDPGRPFGPWFMRVVVNDTLMEVTRRRTVPLEDDNGSSSINSLPAIEPDLTAALEAAETRKAIWQTLERLSPNQRAAILLRYYLDLNDTEVASRLHVPPGTVRRRLHDARQRLRQLLPAWITQPAEE